MFECLALCCQSMFKWRWGIAKCGVLVPAEGLSLYMYLARALNATIMRGSVP
eukprot:m.143624 g.143624  ORF g.143624 m.143624 type:complete len:52 (+) comp16021_c0_seq2:227-382(+)